MLVFIRHGESIMNLPGEYVEDTRAPLTETGKNQAKSFFQKRPFLKDFILSHAVTCSTATRCIETAEFLGLKNFRSED